MLSVIPLEADSIPEAEGVSLCPVLGSPAFPTSGLLGLGE